MSFGVFNVVERECVTVCTSKIGLVRMPISTMDMPAS
jgi:hypothetical protein